MKSEVPPERPPKHARSTRLVRLVLIARAAVQGEITLGAWQRELRTFLDGRSHLNEVAGWLSSHLPRLCTPMAACGRELPRHVAPPSSRGDRRGFKDLLPVSVEAVSSLEVCGEAHVWTPANRAGTCSSFASLNSPMLAATLRKRSWLRLRPFPCDR